MLDVPLIDELREVRRRLSEQCGNDAYRYMQMLMEHSRERPAANYITEPFPHRETALPPTMFGGEVGDAAGTITSPAVMHSPTEPTSSVA